MQGYTGMRGRTDLCNLDAVRKGALQLSFWTLEQGNLESQPSVTQAETAALKAKLTFTVKCRPSSVYLTP